MPVYKNNSGRHITHMDKYSGSKWTFAPYEEKTLDFYLDEPLEPEITIIDESPIPNPIAKFETFSGNAGDTVEIELTGDTADYYGVYDISVKVDAGSVDLAFNDVNAPVKTAISAGEVWVCKVHKKYLKKIIFFITADSTAGKIELFKTE